MAPKILTLFDSVNRGGSEEYALTLASSLVDRGWAVTAAFPNVRGTQSLIHDFRQNGIHFCQRTSRSSLGLLAQIFFALPLLLRSKPDVVLVNIPWPNMSVGVTVACALLHIRTMLVFHLVPRKFDFSKKRLYACRWAKSRRQKWVTISEECKKNISKSFETPVTGITTIYNGVKVNKKPMLFDDNERESIRSKIRKSLGLPLDARILLTIGRLGPQKGHQQLLAVIPTMVREFPDVKFVWVGEGILEKTLQNEITKMKLSSNVVLTGYRTDVVRILRASDLFISPSLFEGFPFALLEAMAQGLPIVMSDKSGINEVIKTRTHGLIFASGDEKDLLITLRWALSNPAILREISQNAYELVQNFSEERMLDKTFNAIKDVQNLV